MRPGVPSALRMNFRVGVRTPWLFFDLEQDPLEQTNLAGEAARWEEMAALIALIGR
jgi:hypothetical protein